MASRESRRSGVLLLCCQSSRRSRGTATGEWPSDAVVGVDAPRDEESAGASAATFATNSSRRAAATWLSLGCLSSPTVSRIAFVRCVSGAGTSTLASSEPLRTGRDAGETRARCGGPTMRTGLPRSFRLAKRGFTNRQPAQATTHTALSGQRSPALPRRHHEAAWRRADKAWLDPPVPTTGSTTVGEAKPHPCSRSPTSS
jgi:hypothetical protein